MGVLDSLNIEDDVVKEVPPMTGPNTKAKPDDDAVRKMLEEIKAYASSWPFLAPGGFAAQLEDEQTFSTQGLP